jgi:hypothetical protein
MIVPQEVPQQINKLFTEEAPDDATAQFRVRPKASIEGAEVALEGTQNVQVRMRIGMHGRVAACPCPAELLPKGADLIARLWARPRQRACEPLPLRAVGLIIDPARKRVADVRRWWVASARRGNHN